MPLLPRSCPVTLAGYIGVLYSACTKRSCHFFLVMMSPVPTTTSIVPSPTSCHGHAPPFRTETHSFQFVPSKSTILPAGSVPPSPAPAAPAEPPAPPAPPAPAEPP